MVASSEVHRRRFTFSVRTLFALVTVISIAMGYLGWHLRIIQQRRLMARTIINRGVQMWVGLTDLEAALFLDTPKWCWGRRRAEMEWGPWPSSAFQITWLRRQLGDIPVYYVVVPVAEKAAVKDVFPEAIILPSVGTAILGPWGSRPFEPFEDRRPDSWK